MAQGLTKGWGFIVGMRQMSLLGSPHLSISVTTEQAPGTAHAANVHSVADIMLAAGTIIPPPQDEKKN